MPNNIHPVTCYHHAHDAIDWLCRAFGFTRGAVHEDDGRVAHAELHLGAATFGLSSSRPPDPTNVWSTTEEGLYVSVDDADALHARAVAAGADIVMPLTDTPYGSRDFGVRDPDGHLWGFGTYAMGQAPERPLLYPGVRDASTTDAVSYLDRTFGFDEGRTTVSGSARSTEVWSGAGLVLVVSGDGLAERWAGRRQGTFVYVADPDAHHAQAVAAGATPLQPPADEPDGSRAYVALDLEDRLWSFGTHEPTRQA